MFNHCISQGGLPRDHARAANAVALTARSSASGGANQAEFKCMAA